MPRLTSDQWEDVRAEREAGTSFGDLAERHGVSKAAILKRAHKEGWSNGENIAAIVRRKVSEKMTGAVTVGNPQKKAAALDRAAEAGAKIIRLQQRDWESHRNRFGPIPEDFETGKLAKISAEMLALRHKGERIAHGLDDAGGGEHGGTIVQVQVAYVAPER